MVLNVYIGVLRPILYFAQAIQIVTVQNGLVFYLSPVISFLSFDVLDGSNGSGVCFIDGLSALDKQFLFLFFPTIMFVSIGFYAIINISCKRGFDKQIRFLSFGWNVVIKLFIILVKNISMFNH